MASQNAFPADQREPPVCGQAFLAAIVNSSEYAVIGKTVDGRVVSWNQAATALFGYTPEEALDRTFAELLVPPGDEELLAEVQDVHVKALDGRQRVRLRTRRMAKGGRLVPVSLTLAPVLGQNGELLGSCSIFRDVSEEENTRAELARSEALLEAMSRASLDATIMVDDQGIIRFWNPAAERIFGYRENEALGRDLHALLAGGDFLERAARGLSEFARTGEGLVVDRTSEFQVRRADGEHIHVELCVAPFFHDDHWFAVGSLRDVTVRKLAEEQLNLLATTDELTGIFNRRRFMETAESEFARAARYNNPLSLIVFDIDYFKRINDSLGHAAGDEALKTVARLVTSKLRGTDVLARIGGEEFAILLPETALGWAQLVADRCRLAIERAALAWEDRMFTLTASFGVAELQPGEALPEFIERADKAIYKAKQGGRNRVERAAV